MSARYPKTGTVLLGKYRVESIIGEGGMGGVLKAWHIDLDEPVAIKVLLPEMMERSEIVQRFMREAKAAVKLKGEHVARVLDVGKLEGDVDGRLEGTPYIVMEFLDGADLKAILKHHGPQEPDMAVDLMLQACEAIAEAHSLGIIHRDIKASNFFVTQSEGEPPQLKVLDFGIATTPKGTSDLTDGGSVIGTPSYMAPEQMRSSRMADARSDIWSLGVVLYEMLEGARPFRAEAYSDLCLKVGMDPPEPMVQPSTPDTLRAIVMKCLEKPIERRYQSVAELAFDLLPFASDQVRARATVEQTARLLTRRGGRAFDVSRAADDLTPAPGGVPRRTASIPYAAERAGPVSSLTPAGGVPILRVPTSTGESSGEQLSHSTSRSQVSVSQSTTTAKASPKRGLIIGASFLVAIALAGGGVLLFSGSKDSPSVGGVPSVPVDDVETPVKMDPTPQVVTSAGSGSPVGSAAGSAVGSAGSGAGSDATAEIETPAGSGSGSGEIANKKKLGGGKVIRKVIKKHDPYSERR
jgi:eukaryotic-like serine/threonine-protein kinase